MAEKTTTTLHEDAALSLLRCDNLLVAVWRQAPTVAQMKLVGTHIAAIHRDFGANVGFVNMAASGKPEFLTKEVREEANRLARRWPRICSAHIVLVGGLPGMVVRSILRAVGVVAGGGGARRVFDDWRTAAPWIAGCLDRQAGRSWAAADVEAVLRDAARRSPA